MDETQALLGLGMNILEDVLHTIFDEMAANDLFVGGQSQGWSSSISPSQPIKLGALELLADVLNLFDVFQGCRAKMPVPNWTF